MTPPERSESQPAPGDDDPFGIVPGKQQSTPDIGRLVEFDESPATESAESDTEDFITDPMQRAAREEAAEIEREEQPVVTERKPEVAGEELIVPVVVSRSQVRKTIPLRLRLEIRVVDD